MKILIKITKIIMALILLLYFNSCKSVEPCPDEPQPGNAGSMFNSEYNEYAPVFFENKLYFTTTREKSNKSEAIFYSEMKNGQFQAIQKDEDLPLNKIQKSGLPAFYQNGEVTELYFAAPNESNGRISRDIFYSERINGIWSEPYPLENVNTESYESYPSLSKDGMYLLFISDREGSIGDIDIYISMRNADGSWSEAVNLGPEINTEYTELSPHLDEMNNLYYASRGFTQENDFEIIKATPLGSFKWKEPSVLDMPINTGYDETCPFIYEGKIYFSSDRKGGCGGEDIYSFEICGPVYVKGKIIREESNIPITGYVELIHESEVLDRKDIDESGDFNFAVDAMKEYNIIYHNHCFTEFSSQKQLLTPCSDTSAVMMQFNYILPEMTTEFDFAEYNVPFFVSGYYRPNTSKNLEDLRMKFSYNLFTDAAETRYIENPEDNYNQYTEIIRSALDRAYSFVDNVLTSVQSECATKNLNSINITVKGYSDPRQISEYAIYADNDINDTNLDVFVQKGQKMDNTLLSELRAYYTAKHIENKLKTNPGYINAEDKIKWNIEGMGIDESDIENKLKRRVRITIRVN